MAIVLGSHSSPVAAPSTALFTFGAANFHVSRSDSLSASLDLIFCPDLRGYSLERRKGPPSPQPLPTPQPKLGSDVDDRLALTQLRRRRPAVPSGVDQNHKLVGAAPGPPHGHRHLLDRGKPEKRRLLPAAMAYQATLSPGLYGFCQESDSLKYELNAAVFLASIGIIVLLLNGRLPTRGIRCYAVWACATIAFVGLIGAFAAGRYSWKVSVVDVLLLVLAVITCISLQILGVEDDELGPVPEDGEQEVGITGERTEEAPLGVLEISTPIIGSAFTVILGIPVMATVDFLVKLPVAILIVSILVSIWQRSFARLLGALARPLRRRCIIPNHGAASSTPREQLVSSLCHGACKVIDSLRSGEWMLVVVLVIWKPELRQNLKAPRPRLQQRRRRDRRPQPRHPAAAGIGLSCRLRLSRGLRGTVGLIAWLSAASGTTHNRRGSLASSPAMLLWRIDVVRSESDVAARDFVLAPFRSV
ncbi:hypothetical protein BRADI_4g43350v3 [Brachypodium distachyon]|uniref:Uncharacterized protein n=1 Tax=Brachypodium distachyon TaxID=15368 RepID=A0A2K2CTZ6_BRADI|nr:hypothetical protein BRADI_4g43350v3 [Brachypodium distachyon]